MTLRALGLGFAALALACAAPAWDPQGLAQRHPALVAAGAQNLADARPYLLPVAGTLTAFLCRWPDGEPIPVSLPPDASEDERSVLEAALRAWEGAGLDVRFAAGDAALVGIEIRFVERDVAGVELEQSATTVADCLVGREGFEGPPSARLPARLSHASIHLRRSNSDTVGRPVPLSPAELAGSALHELGHALGFQGHAQRGDGVMVSGVDQVRRRGKQLLAGEAFRDACLGALYAVPSGVVVRRIPVGADETRPVDAMLELARRRGLFGPFVRVGDRAGRIGWRGEDGESYALLIPEPGEVLRARAPLRVVAYGASAALLAEAR